MEKIKDELGPDAIILSIKKTQPRGLFAFFRRQIVEVTAAYDERFPERAAGSATNGEPVRVPKLLREPEGAKDATLDFSVGETASENAASSEAEEHFAEVFQKNKKIIELEEVVRGLQKKIHDNEETISKMAQQLNNIEPSAPRYQNSLVQIIYDTLIEQAVLPEIAEKMLEDAASVAGGDCDDIELVTKIVYNTIIQALGEPCPIEVGSDEGKLSAAFFLGPTGVGKTTTIAKLSSSFILNNNFNVGLITSDTYRIAAVEQLKVYGEILGIDVNVVYKTDDLLQSLKSLRKLSDIVLIDTAGRSHKNSQNLQELKDLLDVAPDSRKFLVLSTATKYEDIQTIVEIYTSITDFSLIFTKLDETSSLGSILNICCTTRKCLSYVTYGQNVPDDIEIVQPGKVAKALLGFGGDLF